MAIRNTVYKRAPFRAERPKRSQANFAPKAEVKAGRCPDDVPVNLMYSEVKKPGQSTWLRFDQRNPRPFTAVTIPTCADGSKPVPVTP
jgi:hypothetical protein